MPARPPGHRRGIEPPGIGGQLDADFEFVDVDGQFIGADGQRVDAPATG